MSNDRTLPHFVCLPDTQVCARRFPETLRAQADWIVEHAADWNIRAVLHEGDVVDRGATEPQEWKNAKDALARIDRAGIPLLIAIGNHDYDEQAKSRDASMFNKYFGAARYAGRSWFGGAFDPERSENVYALFEVEGRTVLVLVLEFGPRHEVVDWANDVIAGHPEARVVVLTHNYMYDDDTRVGPGDLWNPHDYGIGDNALDGEELWDNLVCKHPNVVLVQSGHILGRGVARRVDRGAHGNPVLQVLANYQMQPNGGEGFMRLVGLNLDNGTIDVQAYSPLLDQFKTDPDNRFTFTP